LVWVKGVVVLFIAWCCFSTLDLPKIKLSKAEQAQLDAQRQAQQTRLDNIKAQLEALQGDLQCLRHRL
jgi:Tfp pilus assembly protein PilO